MIIFVLWSSFVSAPADRTVPGTHPVEYILKSTAALYIMQIIHCCLSSATFSTFH